MAAICCISALLCPAAAAVVSPNDGFYVYDGAQVLSQETEQYIRNASQELESKTGAQIVVVTIPSLDGQALEEYATELFRQWGIGDAKKDNGLLLLCAVEDRKFRVEVGYGLEGDLPDGKTGRMQDAYIIPLLQENKFNEGIKNGYSAFLQEVANVYGVSITGEPAISYEEDNAALLVCMGIGIALSFLGRSFLLKKKKPYLTTAFWITEVVQLIVMAVVLQSLMNALWIIIFSLTFSLGFGSGRWRRFGSFYGGGFGGGHFGGGFGGGGSFGGGGRSGGGGSSRGF